MKERRTMIGTLNKLGDRLLDKLLPSADAAAACYVERCCGQKYCRTCCPGGPCGGWYYC